MVGQHLTQTEKGQRDEQVEGPVEGGADAAADASSPQWVDFRCVSPLQKDKEMNE